MLPGGTDPFYRQILSAGHRHYVRVEVWSGSGALLAVPVEFTGSPEGGVVLSSGSVVATLNSRVSRNVTVGFPYEMYPVNVSDLLAPFGNELRIFRGVMLADGSDVYVWQVFRGKISTVSQAAGGCTVTATDRAAEVIDHAFVSPQNSEPANTISQEFERLILDALPDASFGTSDVFSSFVRPLTWEFDRGAALDEMATSVGAVWFALADGSFVLRRFPWTVAADPVVTFTDQVGGTVLDWAVSRSRESIFNVVTVTGELLNGDAPVHATALDNVVGSPTNVSGSFGVRSRLERLLQPSSTGRAQTAANALLRTYVTPTEQWSLQMVPDASLELGDVVRLLVGGRDVIQVVSDIGFPLENGSMTVSTRSLVVGGA